ncbi:E3 ubiquitin/ISG15 ligase TRIM25 [Aplochiton taeniatus]
MSLEEELTCSICLCTFDCPVTIPCGHNFCQDCLFATWKDVYSCPQCRTTFPTKPELKKNTVLTAVVNTFKTRSMTEPLVVEEEVEAKKMQEVQVILCDTCMATKASKTCLTCMASFCEEHMKPHQENPIFRSHQLSDPLGDLHEYICPDHHKMMEFFCVQHARCICSFCLQQVHKGCQFSTPDDQRVLKETDMHGKLSTLDGKIEKNKTVVSQMVEQQSKLKDSAAGRKRALEDEYRQMRELLEREEREALNTVDREQESGQARLQGLIKKFNQNVEKLSRAKDEITSVLEQSRNLAFLQATVDLPSVVTFDPYTPKVTLDSKAVTASQAFAALLKEHLAHVLSKPVEERLQILKPDVAMLWQVKHLIPSLCQILMSGLEAFPQEAFPQEAFPQEAFPQEAFPQEAFPQEGFPQEAIQDASESNKKSDKDQKTENGTVLTLDPKTAHKRISLSDNLTNATVSDEPTPYPDGPARFSVCSQVLCSKGFSKGRHYWEVKMSSNNFIGIGLAYNSIDRKGPASRLGRNAQSWCVEWFNVKLSAWHASSEKVLENPNPKRVGVLLDCEDGAATFYNVAERAYPFYTFVFPFAEAVYPAFWIFSSGSSVKLCKLQG